jgi:CheY-like chemotaxis protein
MARAMLPEIVFLDLGLPKLNGLEVARRLRTSPIRPRLLVATTGFGREEDRRRTAEAGFDHHLVKPIDPQALRSLLSTVV